MTGNLLDISLYIDKKITYNTMKNTVLTALLLLCALVTKGQELNSPQLSQYLADNPFVLSPTYAGIGDHVKIRVNGLTQWVGIEDAPDTQSLAADMRVGNRSGVGVFLYNDKNGYTKQQGARLSFAHHLTGITDDRSTINHNFDVGFLYRKNKYYLSLNASNLLGKDLSTFNVNFEPNKLRNYYVYTGYRYKKSKNSDLEIEPSVLYKLFESDGRSETDFNLKFRFYDFEDYYYAGVNYRFLNDQIGKPLYIAPIVGLKKSNLYFGYSYQIIMNEILGFSSGTHVITLGVDLFQGLSNCRCTY